MQKCWNESGNERGKMSLERGKDNGEEIEESGRKVARQVRRKESMNVSGSRVQWKVK